jgi:putative SOS response-associated peptidase YedK
MCGRYASARKRQELLEEFLAQADHVAEPLEPDYNVAPTKPVYGVLARRERGASSDGAARDGAARDGAARDGAPVDGGASGRTSPASAASAGKAATHGSGSSDGSDSGYGSDSGDRGDDRGRPVTRQLRVLRWGLVPSWAKDPSLGNKLINARAETVAIKPAFRRAFARRRCLLPADGYYEWRTTARGGGRARKQPFLISPRAGNCLAMAGLYELWRAPDLPADHPDAWLWTATIITTRATDDFGHIHDRMPMVVERDHWAQWLDPACTGPDELSDLMVPAASVGLDVRPVSPAVNNVRNNGPGLIEPVSPGEDPAEAPASIF